MAVLRDDDTSAEMNRSVWKSRASFVCFGRTIGIRSTLPNVPLEMIERLPPDSIATADADVDVCFSHQMEPGANAARHVLFRGAEVVARSTDARDIYEAFENEAQLAVAELAVDRICIHAGAVAWRGRGLILPGQSMAGKSTLIAALLRLGAVYYSDEYAVLDRRGMLHPFPRRLSLRQKSGPPLRVHARELGAVTGATPIPIGLVALARFDRHSNWLPRRFSPGRAALAVLDHVVAGQSRPDEVMDALKSLCSRTPVLEGRRGDADRTAELLLQSLVEVPSSFQSTLNSESVA